MRSLEQGAAQKIVIARKSSFRFSGDLNPISLLLRLKSAMPRCFLFCFMPKPGVAFVGASPERLYRRQGRLIWSEAIAGTRPRGSSWTEEKDLGQELLTSDKDLREHRFVVRGIEETLARLCPSVQYNGNVSLLRLAHCQHLIAILKGTLGNDFVDADIIGRLQPTPAVGGYPSAPALAAIEKLESFDRGWYAGPIGWVAPNAAEFAVGIRSGLIDRSRLCLFSGAGIVEGSTPGDEWYEIEHKISDFINVLTTKKFTSK
jgi:menaquinone-specific isochorismate synthase